MYTFAKIFFLFLIFAYVLPVTVDDTDAANHLNSQTVIDARQEAQLWTTYTLNPYLRGNNINVLVDDGKVTLTGTVNEAMSKELASQIARYVHGIKVIDNQLVIDAGYTPLPASHGYAEEIDDVTITATIKSKLIWSKYRDSESTYIETTGRDVTLRGTTEDSESRTLAGSLALSTRGVESVKNLLLINYANTSSGKNTNNYWNATPPVVVDSWITSKVRSTFRYSNSITDSVIDVSTAQGIVILKGTLKNSAEHALAVELARNIRGVKDVKSDELGF